LDVYKAKLDAREAAMRNKEDTNHDDYNPELNRREEEEKLGIIRVPSDTSQSSGSEGEGHEYMRNGLRLRAGVGGRLPLSQEGKNAAEKEKTRERKIR